MTERVHLLDLKLRTSAAGNEYLSGWLGKAAVVGFRDREAEGEVWQIFVSTPALRPAAGNESASASRSPFTPRRASRPRPGMANLAPGELDDDLNNL